MKRLLWTLLALGLLVAPSAAQLPPTPVVVNQAVLDSIGSALGRALALYGQLGRAPLPPPVVDTVPADTTTVPPTEPPDPPPAGVVIASSDWSTCAGVTNACWLDGQRFWQVAPSGQPPRSMEVVPGAPLGWTATPNVMQVTHLGANGNAFVQSNTIIPEGRDFYVRFYVRAGPGMCSTVTNHSIKLDFENPQQVFWAVHNASCAGAGSYRPFFNITKAPFQTGAGTQRQFHPPAIAQGAWYRFEFHVEITNVAARQFRTWPRIYDAAGTLVADSDDYTLADGTTLTAWYGSGGLATADSLDQLRRFAMGIEGPVGGPNNERWYYASPAICTSWCGAR